MFPAPQNYPSWQIWADALVYELELTLSLAIEPLSGNVTYTPGTISGSGHVSTTVVVPRARVGMFSMASFSVADPKVKLVSMVSADDTVSVSFLKLGSGSATLPQGILRVRVFPLRAGE